MKCTTWSKDKKPELLRTSEDPPQKIKWSSGPVQTADLTDPDRYAPGCEPLTLTHNDSDTGVANAYKGYSLVLKGREILRAPANSEIGTILAVIAKEIERLHAEIRTLHEKLEVMEPYCGNLEE